LPTRTDLLTIVATLCYRIQTPLYFSLSEILSDRETNLKGYMEDDHSNCVVHDDTFDWGG